MGTGWLQVYNFWTWASVIIKFKIFIRAHESIFHTCPWVTFFKSAHESCFSYTSMSPLVFNYKLYSYNIIFCCFQVSCVLYWHDMLSNTKSTISNLMDSLNMGGGGGGCTPESLFWLPEAMSTVLITRSNEHWCSHFSQPSISHTKPWQKVELCATICWLVQLAKIILR